MKVTGIVSRALYSADQHPGESSRGSEQSIVAMPINIEDYEEEDRPAYAWEEPFEVDDVHSDWPYEDPYEFIPYDGPYEEIQESFGRAGPSRYAEEPAGEVIGAVGRAGARRDAVVPAGDGANWMTIHRTMAVLSQPEPNEVCAICGEGYEQESNPAVSAFNCSQPHRFCARCIEQFFRNRASQNVCPYCRASPRGPPPR